MQINSKLAAAAALVGGAAAQGVYISPGTPYFAPGTFGQTFSDGSYISAGVAQKPGEYNDVSYAAQNGGPAANVGYNNFPPPQPFNPYPPPQPFGYPGPAPVQSYPAPYQTGQQNFQPPPPPVYVAGTNAPSDSNGPPPLVTVGQDIHTGGFKQKRSVETTEKSEQYWPYNAYNAYGSYGGWRSPYYNNWYNGPTVTIGAPTAYFAPGTFGQTWSDGSYVSAGVPRPFKKLNKRQVITTGGLFGPTVSIGAPTAYFAPGTFGQTFSDGGYTSWGVPTVPSYPTSYYYKRE